MTYELTTMQIVLGFVFLVLGVCGLFLGRPGLAGIMMLGILASLCTGCQSNSVRATVYVMPPAVVGHDAPHAPSEPGVAESATARTVAKSATPAHERSGEAQPFRAGCGAAAPITITISTYNDKPVDVSTRGALTANGNSVATGAGAVGGAVGAALGGPAGAALGAAGGSVAAEAVKNVIAPASNVSTASGEGE